MSRLDKIRLKWPDSRLSALPGIPNELSGDDIFACIIKVDPTVQHKMVDWILGSWERKGFLWEDIRSGASSKIAQTLSDFERLKTKLTLENGKPDTSARSLMNYKTPGEVWTRIRPLLELEESLGETQGSRTQKRLDMAKARLETYSMALETGVQMDIPMTQFSAMIMGRTTKWCTAADNDNMFDRYAEQGPLMIFTLPDGTRFQAHGVIDEKVDYEDLPFGGYNDDDDEDEEIPSNSISGLIDKIVTSLNHLPKEEVEGGYDEHSVYYECLEKIISDMDFMNEADNSPTSEEKKKLEPYLQSISETIADVFMKSSGLRKDGHVSNITPDKWSRIVRDMSTMLVKRLSPEPVSRKKENSDTQEPDISKVSPAPSMEDIFEEQGLIKKDGRNFSFNVLENETWSQYYERFEDTIYPFMNKYAGWIVMSKLEDWWRLTGSNIPLPEAWLSEIKESVCKDKPSTPNLSRLVGGLNFRKLFANQEDILFFLKNADSYYSNLNADNLAFTIDNIPEDYGRDSPKSAKLLERITIKYAIKAMEAGHDRDVVSNRLYQRFLASKPEKDTGNMIAACGEMLACITNVSMKNNKIPKRCQTTESVIDACLDLQGKEKTNDARKEISDKILLSYCGHAEKNSVYLPKTLGGLSMEDRRVSIQASLMKYARADADIQPGSGDAMNMEIFKNLGVDITSWSHDKFPAPVQEAAYILMNLEQGETDDPPKFPRVAGKLQDFYIHKMGGSGIGNYTVIKAAEASHLVAFPDQNLLSQIQVLKDNQVLEASPEMSKDIERIQGIATGVAAKENAVSLTVLNNLERSQVVRPDDAWKYGFLKNTADQELENTYSDAPEFQFLAPPPFRPGF